VLPLRDSAPSPGTVGAVQETGGNVARPGGGRAGGLKIIPAKSTHDAAQVSFENRRDTICGMTHKTERPKKKLPHRATIAEMDARNDALFSIVESMWPVRQVFNQAEAEGLMK